MATEDNKIKNNYDDKITRNRYRWLFFHREKFYFYEIAKRLGIIHLDTGALYRAITYFALQNCPSSDGFNTEALVEQLPNIHLEFKEEQHQLSLFLNGENVAEKIRSMEVNQK